MLQRCFLGRRRESRRLLLKILGCLARLQTGAWGIGTGGKPVCSGRRQGAGCPPSPALLRAAGGGYIRSPLGAQRLRLLSSRGHRAIRWGLRGAARRRCRGLGGWLGLPEPRRDRLVLRGDGSPIGHDPPMRAQQQGGTPGDRPAVRGAGHRGARPRGGERPSVLHREVRDEQPAGALVGLGSRLAAAQQLGLRG